jgi:hypothetical protein
MRQRTKNRLFNPLIKNPRLIYSKSKITIFILNYTNGSGQKNRQKNNQDNLSRIKTIIGKPET